MLHRVRVRWYFRTQPDIQKGLMNNPTPLLPYEVVVFDFMDHAHMHGDIFMWMKNTMVSLDMIFLDKNKKIIHIHQGAIPYDMTFILAPTDTRFVLEALYGFVYTRQLHVGDSIQFV
jgi:uncharacterized membrane protein (UPF0127 family)